MERTQTVKPVIQTPVVAVPALARRRRIRWGDMLAPYLFISPFLIAFVLLFLGPAAYSLYLSFFRYKGYGKATYVGVSNYHAILTYHVFWTEVRNTIFYWLGHVFIMLIGAFLLAVLVRSTLVRWKGVYKPLIFLPNILATVATALIFQSLFGTEYGVINTIFGTHVPWLQNYSIAKWVVVLMLIWHGIGWWFVIFLAGLTTINPEVEEAAIVDGASTSQRLRYIILPLMRGTFLFAFVLDAIGSFRLFNEPNVLVAHSGSLADPAISPILNLLITNLRGADFGGAAAVGWLLFILVAIVAYFQFRILRTSGEESQL